MTDYQKILRLCRSGLGNNPIAKGRRMQMGHRRKDVDEMRGVLGNHKGRPHGPQIQKRPGSGLIVLACSYVCCRPSINSRFGFHLFSFPFPSIPGHFSV